MTQETRYAGYSAQPSDYDCPDGQLAASLNLISEDNSLKPLFSPHTVTTLPDGDRIIFVHTTAVFSHYIVLDAAGNVCWTPPDGEKKTFLQVPDIAVHKINAVGNTLCILLSSGLHYVLWKDSGYKYLGQKPPEANLSFFTSDNYPAAYDRDTVETTDTDKVYYHAWRATGLKASECLKTTAGSTTVPFTAEHKSGLQNPIWALINQTNALVSKQGHFYAPFFVRYCYRMYDGSQWMASPPVFMPVAMPSAYRVEVPNLGYQTAADGTVTYKVFDSADVYEPYDKSEKAFSVSSLTFLYRPHNVDLAMRATGDIASLKADWGDIVKSIDIFVSLPIVREDPSGTVASASLPSDTYGLRGGTLRKSFKNGGVMHSGSGKWNCNTTCDIPLLSEDAYMDKIRSVSSFYKVYSFDLETDTVKPDTFQPVPIDASVLPVLATQETLQDDYKSRNTILPLLDDRGNCVTSLYNYNGRQNIAGFRERLFGGFTPEVFAPYSTWNPYKDEDGDYYCADGDKAPMNVEKAYVYLATEDGERVVCADGLALSVSPMIYFNCPLFYPDNRAVRMELLSNGQLYVLKMQACPLLNGAFTTGGVMSSTETAFTTKTAGEAPSVSDTVSAASKICTSETNNPFFFPVTGINSVGTGRILGICSAAKALSQGQFGQFPLYAFTTEGVWALEVSSTGSYSARQPITRDVCTNSEGITQLDSAVLFPTGRGIMLISGSQTQCISDSIFAEKPFGVTTLPGMDKLHALLGDSHAADACVPVQPFLGFLGDCRMVYDYVHQRVIVFNPSLSDTTARQLYTYAYVYSLKSQRWGMMYSDFAYAVNSYPDALAVTHDNRLVSFSATDETESRGLFVTRPLKLGAPDTLKTVSTVIQRGLFRRGDVATVLYGSRDLYNWFLLKSSEDHCLRGFRGTPWKYFRIAALTTLTEDKSVSGASFSCEPRYTGRLK